MISGDRHVKRRPAGGVDRQLPGYGMFAAKHVQLDGNFQWKRRIAFEPAYVDRPTLSAVVEDLRDEWASRASLARADRGISSRLRGPRLSC